MVPYLPDDIWQIIIRKCDPCIYIMLRLVCKSFLDIVKLILNSNASFILGNHILNNHLRVRTFQLKLVQIDSIKDWYYYGYFIRKFDPVFVSELIRQERAKCTMTSDVFRYFHKNLLSQCKSRIRVLNTCRRFTSRLFSKQWFDPIIRDTHLLYPYIVIARFPGVHSLRSIAKKAKEKAIQQSGMNTNEINQIHSSTIELLESYHADSNRSFFKLCSAMAKLDRMHPFLELLKDDDFLNKAGAASYPRILSLRDIFLHRYSHYSPYIQERWKSVIIRATDCYLAVCVYLVTRLIENGATLDPSISEMYNNKHSSIDFIQILQSCHSVLDAETEHATEHSDSPVSSEE